MAHGAGLRPRLLACLAALLLGALSPAAARTPLVFYTALEPEQIEPAKAAIEAAVPEVEVRWVRASNGVITDKALSEGRALQADLFFGVAVSSLILLKDQDLLTAYTPKGVTALRPFFRDPGEPYVWTGMDAYLGLVCFNTEEATKVGALSPSLWRDLASPTLQGKVVMPDPALSGTGYILVSGWLQTMGEERGWAFMDALDRNVARYMGSGSAPCGEAAAGRAVAGLSFDMRGAAAKAKGAPIELVVPIDGTGWDLEAFAIAANTQHPELARRVADWAASHEASTLYARDYAIVARPDVTNTALDYPAHAEARMIRVDVTWMARNRARILAEWTRRYGAKAGRPASP